MAENSWPFETVDTSEAQFSKWANALVETGEISGLGVSVSAGMTLALASGSAIVQGMFYENTSAKNLVVGAAPASGSTRLDALVLRLDYAANTITAAIKAGTANTSGGALPALQQDASVYEHRLRTITVPGGAASLVAGNIGPAAPPTGMRVVPYADAPPALTGVPRALGLNLTTRRLSYWNGTSWTELTASVAWGEITGKPATFTPSAHEHTIADITDIANASVANADKVGGRRIFVQSGTPSGAQSGDLWFW